MNAVKVFENAGHSLRVVEINNEPWFVAADVCRALDVGNPSLAVNGRPDRQGDGLDDDERGVAAVNTPSGEQKMLVVSESGLYSLVFKSRKLEAKAFRRWVTRDVLPAIRKTGKYEAPKGRAEFQIPRTLPQALRALADALEENESLRAEVGRLRTNALPLPSPVMTGRGNFAWEVSRWLVPANLRTSSDGKFYITTAREALAGAFGLDGSELRSTDVAMVARILRSNGWTRSGVEYIYQRRGDEMAVVS